MPTPIPPPEFPPSAPGRLPHRGQANVSVWQWLYASLAPLAHGAWLMTWCGCMVIYLLLRRGRWQPGEWLTSVMLTTDAVASGAILATALFVGTQSFRAGWGAVSAGGWLAWIGGIRTLIVLVLVGLFGSASTTPTFVWYAVVSSILFLAPLYLGKLPGEWRQRFIWSVFLQLMPLVVRLVLLLAPSAGFATDVVLIRLFWLPDLLTAVLLSLDARRLSPLDQADELHRAGLILYAIQAVTCSVSALALPITAMI